MPHPDLLDTIPHLRVRGGVVVGGGPDLERELGCSPEPLLGPLTALGRRLDDVSYDELIADEATLRVRFGPEVLDRPVRLRRIGVDGDDVLVEVRSLADEFRLERLLRRGEYGHILLDADVQPLWSMTSNELAEVFPGDDPTEWIELMDPDDMTTLGKAIYAVGADPNERRVVSHRLSTDRTYTIIDTVESAMHDPDLRGVLVRSRLGDASKTTDGGPTGFTGLIVSDHVPIGVAVASPEGRILHRNATAAEFVGARTGQLLVALRDGGDAPNGAASPEPVEAVLDGLAADQKADVRRIFLAAAAGTAGHCTIDSPTDADRALRMSASPAPGRTVVVTIEDTTELAEAERALRASNRLLEAIDANASEIVIVFDADGGRRYVSSSVDRFLASHAEIEHEDDLLAVADPADRSALGDLVRRVRSEPASSRHIEFRVVTGDGTGSRWHHVTATNLLDDPDVQGLLIVMSDVHERHLAERELHFKATHDALTTLPDRASLHTQLESLLRTAESTGDRTALIFCDVDNFKLINDSAGHRVGDAVLTEVASRLRGAIRSGDVVGRFGGDEFVVVAPDVEGEDHALALAQRVFDAVVGSAVCGDVDVTIGLSMGVAVTDADCTAAAGLLHRADLAMYESKRRGRGRISQYSPGLDTSGAGTASLRSDLRAALDTGQLRVHYQPIVALQPDRAHGFETLARWDHPSEGLIDARRFLSVAESAGMIREVGGALVALACDGANRWLADGD
ncbi:MAG: diguanylate cyclase, partial [Actinomycetota bacterium]